MRKPSDLQLVWIRSPFVPEAYIPSMRTTCSGARFALAANMSFTDEDLDETEIGGNLTWYPPEDTSEVQEAWLFRIEQRYLPMRCTLTRSRLSALVLQLLSLTMETMGSGKDTPECKARACLDRLDTDRTSGKKDE